MKVAVCLGGLLRGKVEENIEIMKQVFPYDFFLSTWDTVERFPPFQNIKTYKEPAPFKDHLIFHPNEEKRSQMIHHHKQIISHAYMLDDLPSDYDMIVRIRYESRINTTIDWKSFLDCSYNENIPIGFGHVLDFNQVKKITYGDKGSRTTVLGKGLNDAIIMHPRKLFNSEKVFELYKNDELKLAEGGWWQILVKENFGDVSHEKDPCQNYIGGFIFDRFLE